MESRGKSGQRRAIRARENLGDEEDHPERGPKGRRGRECWQDQVEKALPRKGGGIEEHEGFLQGLSQGAAGKGLTGVRR